MRATAWDLLTPIALFKNKCLVLKLALRLDMHQQDKENFPRAVPRTHALGVAARLLDKVSTVLEAEDKNGKV